MCDQTEVTYAPGDVVWVKLGPVWWPGQVQDYDKLPEEITASLRKKPIAVVKFFQEDTFEYVKNLNQIYQYNCRKKQEFIKKGLDLVRSSNSRDVPSNMKMFPNDIVMAEHLTGGDPNILDDEAYAPEQKSNYSELFGTKKLSGKKLKSEALKKEHDGWKTRKYSNSPLRNGRQSLPARLPSTIPRPITHPRFITKALEGRSDHEIRIRCQLSTPKDDQENTPEKKKYKCHLCEFESVRLNVIVLHNKSHSAGFIEAQNAIRARLKTRERERASPTLNSNNEQTPTTVTSRGRVKSLPKKLMDYTDEPPPKIFKEKTYTKHVIKDEIPESHSKSSNEKSPNKTPNKTPKKTKDDGERVSIKRPLFGKRKTAKEKAELAAKQKQENEAMKEKLLKDWDDDDVNEEEVELERLKQALESTTSSTEYDDDEDDDDKVTDKDIDNEMPTVVPDKPTVKTNEKVESSNDKISKAKNDIKTKVFEFDDSEDSLPVNINFRLKSQREKFTDDKFKKPRPPKPLIKLSPKPKLLMAPPPPPLLSAEKKEEDKETDEFNKAFNALLEETVVPVLPEIPKTSLSISQPSGEISDQTSDISSSTDLLEISDTVEISEEENNKDEKIIRHDSDIVNEDLKMECTSSDNEEVNSGEAVVDCDVDENKIEEDQKNFKGVSANDPVAEMDTEVLSSGVATTTTDEITSFPFENEPINENSQRCEDSTATEISSTCDVTMSCSGNAEVTDSIKEEICIEDNSTKPCENMTGFTDGSVTEDKSINKEDLNIDIEKLKSESSTENNFSKTLTLGSTSSLAGIEQVQEAFRDTTNDCIPTDSNDSETILESHWKHSKNNANIDHLQLIHEPSESSVIVSSINESDEIKIETEVVSEESVTSQNEQFEIVKEEVIEETPMEIEQSVPQQLTPAENFKLLLHVGPESDTNTANIKTQQERAVETNDPKLEISENIKLENQSVSQNLQDMELDINSMPVIIGGEDYIQPEQPKQNLVPIQPKYSESIVISPKTSASSPNKSEGVIMHLGEPSSSNQNVQSVIAIPSKNGRGGKGVKSPKTTSKTIKLSASALKNLSTLQKGGNQQVLILKTASGQDKQDKGTIQKHKGPLNMFQHGNKILIVNNPQMSGQNKIKLNPQQQQLLTGGKLAPGTRVFTSKVVATTTSQASASTSKISTSRSSSKPTQKLVISKGGMLSNTSKSVIINNSTGKLITTVPGTHTITTSKGHTLITHNLLNTKGGLILPSSSQSVSASGKTTTIITSQALSNSKGMILAPITSKGGTILSGNQKLRIVSSKTPISGTRLVVQNPQGKLSIDPQNKGQQLKLISGLRGQSSGNTILIQTSQGLMAKSIASGTTTTASGQPTIRTTGVTKTIMTTIPTQAKIRITTASAQQSQIVQQSQKTQQPQIIQQPHSVQQTQIVQQPQITQPQVVQTPSSVKKVTVQKVRQSPNILQKTTRKATPRASKSSGTRLISPAVSAPEPVILSTTSNPPVIAQPTLVQAQVPQSTDGLVYLTVDESGNYRQVDNKSLITFEGTSTEAPRTIFIPADSRPQDVGNIFLAIDDAGNIVNITQPAPTASFATENTVPSQDILAKALANTQVLQQETIIPDIDVSTALSSASMDSSVLASSSFNDHAQYPAPSLSHSVLETSLTLNQPIMTPLEVPSAVPPNLGQISSLSSNYITSNLLTPKQKHIRPSMPLLTEESLANQARGEPVFLLDSSNNIIPATSNSQISFQLTLDENNVIMNSGTGGAVLPPTYQVVSGDMLTSQLVASGESQSLPKIENVTPESIESQEKLKFESGENISFSILPQTEQVSRDVTQTVQHSEILREALEARQANVKNESYLTSMEIPQSELTNCNSVEGEFVTVKDEKECENIQNLDLAGSHPEQYESQDASPSMIEEEKHSLKRSLGEEQTVTSSSDSEDASKRIRIDER